MCKVIILKEAQKDIHRLPHDEIPGVMRKISSLVITPRPFNCKKLVGSYNAYRIVKGDYRILYTVDDGNKEVKIHRVKHRREAYRSLWF